jgi:hypothetical protein
MKVFIYKFFSIILWVSTIAGLTTNAFGWSWKELKIGVMTEEELFKFGGWPIDIVFTTPGYFEIKKGKKCYPSFVEYEDSELIRFKVGPHGAFSWKGKVWYDPTKTPILTTAPLQLSHEIERIKMRVHFDYNGKLYNFYYDFDFFSDKKVDKKKYVDIFNTILGKPFQINEAPASIVIEYERYTVSISSSKIRLMAPLAPLSDLPMEVPKK